MVLGSLWKCASVLELLWVFYAMKYQNFKGCRPSDFFQDWWAEVTHGAKKNVDHFLK